MGAALLGAVALAGCKGGEGGPGTVGATKGPVPVVVSTVVEKAVPTLIETIGTVEALHTVAVMAQVGGEILKVHFEEGGVVQAGDLLFTIDTRPYRATLGEARARLAKDQALLAEARGEAERYRKLLEQGVVSDQEYQQKKSDAEALEASVDADRSSVTSSAINVQYATIRAPIAGRTGTLLVNAGNVVKPSNETLVTIRQVAPIDVRFSVPERHLPPIRRQRAAGEVRVTARPRGDDGREVHTGHLTFIENTVDSTTGAIAMKAEFPNEDESLWPGQFVDVVIELGTEAHRIVVPAAAVLAGQDGPYLYAVAADGKAEVRHLEIARRIHDEVVIAKGVRPGDRVVIVGQERLSAGTPLAPETREPAAPSGASSAAPTSPEHAATTPPKSREGG